MKFKNLFKNIIHAKKSRFGPGIIVFIIIIVSIISVTAYFVNNFQAVNIKADEEQQFYKSFLKPEHWEPYSGDKDAPVTVIQFADPLCPGGKYFFDEIEPVLRKNYIDKGLVKFYYWPMIFSETSILTLEGMHCANEQNKFWEYRRLVHLNHKIPGTFESYSREKHIDLAKQTNLNTQEFISCLDSGKYEDFFRQKDTYRKRADILASTSVTVNNKLISPVTIEEIQRVVDNELISAFY